MAYSLIEQESLDLDIFCLDNKKLIHIASGGGKIPNPLLETDVYNEPFLESVNDLGTEFEIDINPNLTELLDINDDELNNYLFSFINIAKKGFYTYDKTVLGSFEDMTFHLVAKPRHDIAPKAFLKEYKITNELKITNEFPETFKAFDLQQLIQ